MIECPDCQGHGTVQGKECVTCDGFGVCGMGEVPGSRPSRNSAQ